MKKFDAEKIFFDKLTGFLTLPCFDSCTSLIMVDSAYFVKSTPLRAFIVSFQHCVDIL